MKYLVTILIMLITAPAIAQGDPVNGDDLAFIATPFGSVIASDEPFRLVEVSPGVWIKRPLMKHFSDVPKEEDMADIYSRSKEHAENVLAKLKDESKDDVDEDLLTVMDTKADLVLEHADRIFDGVAAEVSDESLYTTAIMAAIDVEKSERKSEERIAGVVHDLRMPVKYVEQDIDGIDDKLSVVREAESSGKSSDDVLKDRLVAAANESMRQHAEMLDQIANARRIAYNLTQIESLERFLALPEIANAE